MANARPYVIANPVAGGGFDEARWARLVGKISDGLGAFDVAFTEGRGHAEVLARRAAKERAVVVAFGGDGTISEVANGLLAAADAGGPAVAEMAIIPRGTGGDFRRTLGLPTDLAEAARRLMEAPARPLDVGRVTYTADDGTLQTRHFVNVASFGFSSAVARAANEGSKALGGKVAFLAATARTLVTHQNAEIFLRVDGGERLRRTVLLTALGNGRYFGGGMHICPNAAPDNGRLDMVVIGDYSRGEVMTRLPRIFAGTHLSLKEVTELPAVRTLEASPVDESLKVPLELDGETPGRLPATFEIRPAALRVRF